MEAQHLLQLPRLLVARRRQKGLSQKAVAGRAAMQQATLCAFEKGRKWPSEDHVARIASAIGLAEEASSQLQWAARHDSLLVRLRELGLQDASEIVSVALRAAHLLPDEAVAGLVKEMRSILSAQATLSRFRGDPAQLPTQEELPMA